MQENFNPQHSPALKTESAEELAERIKSKEKFIISICRGILGRSGNYDIADAAANQALHKAIKSASQYRGESPLNSWLGRIAKNTALDYLREVNKDRILGKNKVDIEDIDLSDGNLNPEEALIQKEQQELRIDLIRSKLSVLSDKNRKVKEMNLDGLSHNEISEKLGIPLATVKTCIFNSRRIIASSLGQNNKFKY